MDLEGGMGVDTLQHIHYVDVRIDALQQARGEEALDHADVPSANLRPTEEPRFAAHGNGANLPLQVVGMCALRRRIDSPGEIPGRLTVVPAESNWSGSGGDEWAEALQGKAVLDGQRTMRAAA
jgi:hypothetical protein